MTQIDRSTDAAHRIAELEAQLARCTEELKIARQELASFTYSVSHDLRAPLRTILGFGEALSDDHAAGLDGQGREYLRFIREATERMEHLIESLMELSNVSRKELVLETVDLSAVARSVAERSKRQHEALRTDIVIHPGLAGTADPALMEICFRHLLDNAFKFTRRRPSARIEVGSEKRDGAAVLYVRDDGAGFDPAFAEKMFGAFQRLHSQDEFEGVGIGLAVVERIIHRHGGRVWAVGAVDEGATVYFTLP